MADYEYLFSTALHEKLKEKIVGKIFTKITRNDEILVTVDTYEGLSFKMFIGNFSEKMLHGYSSDYAAYEVLKQYKAFVLKRYLK